MEHIHEPLLDHDQRRRRPREGTDSETANALGLGNRAVTAALRGRVDRAGRRSQGAGPLDPEIGAEISSERGGGRPLDDDARADMEGHLDVDLSAVRIHDGAKGDALSRSVQAEAFTTGTDVFFKSGKYQPDTTDGRRLLAHEITHVVQQSSGRTDGAGTVSHPDDAHEHEARTVGDSVAAAAPIARQDTEEEELQMSPDPTALDRQEEEEELLQASPDPTALDRQEEEEELQMSPDPTARRRDGVAEADASS